MRFRRWRIVRAYINKRKKLLRLKNRANNGQRRGRKRHNLSRRKSLRQLHEDPERGEEGSQQQELTVISEESEITSELRGDGVSKVKKGEHPDSPMRKSNLTLIEPKTR